MHKLSPIPGYIIQEVQNKGFYLYDWIDENELKYSLQRDFLKLFDKYGIKFSLLIIVPIMFMIFIGAWQLALWLYGFIIITFVFASIAYLCYISINRTLILRKAVFIIITPKHVRILDEIIPLKDNTITQNTEIIEIEKIFDEELFRPSNIKENTAKLSNRVRKKLLSGYSRIMKKLPKNNRGGFGQELLVILLYAIYLLSIGLLYTVGIFLVIVIGQIVGIINKRYLSIKKDKILLINNGFNKLDDYSSNIVHLKGELIEGISKAKNNNWTNKLSKDIIKSINAVNNLAAHSVEESNKLITRMNNTEYSDMFDYALFLNWLSKNITKPLQEIRELLAINLNNINTALREGGVLEQKYKDSQARDFSATISGSNTRLIMQKDALIKQIGIIDTYIKKLES